MTQDEHKQAIRSIYPFIDDNMADRCYKLYDGINFDFFELQKVFDSVTSEIISSVRQNLELWQINRIRDNLVESSIRRSANLFNKPEAINNTYYELVRLPSSIEDVNRILNSLRREHDTKVINYYLSQIIIYIRNEKGDLRCTTTSEGDLLVVQIEKNLADFLTYCPSSDFHTIYPNLRELVSITPKPFLFGIDIRNLRSDTAYYHENRSEDDPFYQFAEDIREAVHRRLSCSVVNAIDDFIEYLHSDISSAFISGRYCKSTPDQKKKELESESFVLLQDIRNQLQLIWNNPFSRGCPSFSTRTTNSKLQESDSFLSTASLYINQLLDSYRDLILYYDVNNRFIDHIDRIITSLNDYDFQDMSLGETRYYLKNIISNIFESKDGDGWTLLRLLTLDSILENISIIYFSNIVNEDLAKIDDTNFERSVKILPDLALCVRATGQGTKSLGRLALRLNSYLEFGNVDKAEVQACVRTMNEELLSYIFNLTQYVYGVLEASTFRDNYLDIDRAHDQILNNIIREKTTHLFANLLNSFEQYFGHLDNETAKQLAQGRRQSVRASNKDTVNVNDLILRFGPDVESNNQLAVNTWIMGGKGASEAEMSRLIAEGDIAGVDVPKGFILSTQTWPIIKSRSSQKEALRKAIRYEVEVLELRTGKKFGCADNPLILAARSAAVISLPGILPTIAHIGLNQRITEQWAKILDNPYRAYHAYIRFLFNYSEEVLNIEREIILKKLKAKRIGDLCGTDIRQLQKNVHQIKYHASNYSPDLSIPDDCYEQLFQSIDSVLSSYEKYKSHNLFAFKQIPPEYQTACLVQDCLPINCEGDCSGVFLTRDPRDGSEGEIEYVESFGEDLVSGRAKPDSRDQFDNIYPVQSALLESVKKEVEKSFLHPMDIEFVIRDEVLHIIQARPLILSPRATVIINYQLYKEGLIAEGELVERTRRIVSQPLVNTYFDESDKNRHTPIARGQPISGGVATGRLLFDEGEIAKYPNDNIIYITKSNLPRKATKSPQIKGYISEEGGVTSHAALVSIGKLPCIVGIDWDIYKKNIYIGNHILKEGETVSLDANDGYIYTGYLPIHESTENKKEYKEAESQILKIISRINAQSIRPIRMVQSLTWE